MYTINQAVKPIAVGGPLQVDEIIGAPESAENGESQRFGGVTCRRPRRL